MDWTRTANLLRTVRLEAGLAEVAPGRYALRCWRCQGTIFDYSTRRGVGGPLGETEHQAIERHAHECATPDAPVTVLPESLMAALLAVHPPGVTLPTPPPAAVAASAPTVIIATGSPARGTPPPPAPPRRRTLILPTGADKRPAPGRRPRRHRIEFHVDGSKTPTEK
jgi:hypothetical protein